MSEHTRRLARELRAEVERRERELKALRNALTALNGKAANGHAHGRMRGRVSKSS